MTVGNPPAPGNPYKDGYENTLQASATQARLIKGGMIKGGALGISSMPGQSEQAANQALMLQRQTDVNKAFYKGGRKTRRKKSRKSKKRRKKSRRVV